MVLPETNSADDEIFIELVRLNAWPEVVEALRAGHVDGASLLFEAAVTAFNMGSPIRALSLSHRDGNVLVAANYINSLDELAGQTIAIPHSLSPHKTLLGMLLSRYSLSFDDINLVEINPAEMPFTLAARAISAYVVAEPWGTLAEARGAGHILAHSHDHAPGALCCVFVVNTDNLDFDLHEVLLTRFDRAAALTSAFDESVFAAFAETTSFERDIVEISLELTRFTNLRISRDDYERTITILQDTVICVNFRALRIL